jgi:hypothetical protein
MGVLALLVVLGCDQGAKPTPPPNPPIPAFSLDGDIPCGKQTCHSNQICITEQAGHTCWTDADAGIGVYGTHAMYCEDAPPTCHGVPTCNCVPGGGMCNIGTSPDAPTRQFTFACM